MSAAWPGNMSGPRVKSPFLLLLLLLLLTSLTRTVKCQEEDDTDPETETEEGDLGDPPPEDDEGTEPADGAATEPPVTVPTEEILDPGPGEITSTADPTDMGEESGSGSDPKEEIEDEEGFSAMIILIPVVLVVLIIGLIVIGICINRKWSNKAKIQELGADDPFLGSPTEKVPMPMFEEDVPSVLELEMDELNWMKKDGETTEDSKPT